MMNRLTQKELANLAKIYLNARNRLLNVIINYQGVGTKTYYNTILQHLSRELDWLRKASADFIDTAVPREYEQGLKDVYAYFTRNNLLMKRPNMWADIHTDAVYEIAREMQFNIEQGLAQVGRQVLRYTDKARDEALRAAGLLTSGEKIASGSTTIDMKNRLIEQLQNEGFMTVQYGQGPGAYQVPLDVYANMVARSTTREAGNIARENQLVENGYDLVEMTEHYPTCEVCAALQGRVYSISGKDPRFPALSVAFSSGYHNVHPNCRHVIVPWIESLHDPEEVKAAIAKSNKPLKDTRSRHEVELYKRQQTQHRRARQDLYQYERYKARLGNYAPKSYGTFRRRKKQGGGQWGILQAQYKAMGYYEKAVKNEPGISRTVIRIAEKVGMDAVGLEYRIKSKDSFLRKVAANYSPSRTEYEVKDIIRYTYTADPDDLADKVLLCIEEFEKIGYNTIEVKNYWLKPNSPYKGINTTIQAPNDQKFEVQYHTSESFKLKNGELHKLYERWRLLPKGAEEKAKLESKMIKLSKGIESPPNIGKVK